MDSPHPPADPPLAAFDSLRELLDANQSRPEPILVELLPPPQIAPWFWSLWEGSLIASQGQWWGEPDSMRRPSVLLRPDVGQVVHPDYGNVVIIEATNPYVQAYLSAWKILEAAVAFVAASGTKVRSSLRGVQKVVRGFFANLADEAREFLASRLPHAEAAVLRVSQKLNLLVPPTARVRFGGCEATNGHLLAIQIAKQTLRLPAEYRSWGSAKGASLLDDFVPLLCQIRREHDHATASAEAGGQGGAGQEYDGRVRWSPPESLATWRKVFNQSENQIRRFLESGTVRARPCGPSGKKSRQWMVALDDTPEHYRARKEADAIHRAKSQ